MRAIVKQAQKVGCFLQTHDLLQEFSGIGADHIALMFKTPLFADIKDFKNAHGEFSHDIHVLSCNLV